MKTSTCDRIWDLWVCWIVTSEVQIKIPESFENHEVFFENTTKYNHGKSMLIILKKNKVCFRGGD